MKILYPIFVNSILIAVSIAISSSSLYASKTINLSPTDSTIFFIGGLDSLKVDSLLIHRLETKYFVFRFSNNFPHANELHLKASSYDAFCDTVVRILHLPKSSFKANVYLYTDSNEQFLCFKGFPALRENQGFSFLKDIHACGLGAIEHETIHALVADLIAYNVGSFFSEGIEQYVEQVRSVETFRKALAVAKKFINEPFDKWANGTIGFWTTPSDSSLSTTAPLSAYPISGLFVNYLVQNSGLETFKEFYKRSQTEKSSEVAFYITYGYSLSKAIVEFKTTIAGW